MKVIFYISSLLLTVGVYQLYKALRSTDNASIGRYPNTWLYDPTKISGNYTKDQQSDNEGFIITHILTDYQESITIADSSNDYRVRLINNAIKFGIFAVISLLTNPILEVIFYLAHHLQ